MWKKTLPVLLLLACAGCINQQVSSVMASSTPYGTADLGDLQSLTAIQSFPSPITTPPPSEIQLPPTSDSPSLESWIDRPTYPESEPGLNFHLEFNTNRWERAENAMGFPTLVHRLIPSCVITPAIGRGLSPDLVVDHSFQQIGTINFEVNTVSKNGVVQYINYFGGDGFILTGFQVSFEAQMNNCINEAESVLASLSSIPESP